MQPERAGHALCFIGQGDSIHYPVGHPLLRNSLPLLLSKSRTLGSGWFLEMQTGRPEQLRTVPKSAEPPGDGVSTRLEVLLETARRLLNNPIEPKAVPPSRVVRGEEPQDLFRAVKGAFHDLVSSSCTSGKNGTGGGR